MWSALLVVLFLRAASADADADFDEGRIVNGTQVPDGKYPFMVSIQYWKGQICGGTILNSQWFLTAGHCGVYMQPRLYDITILTSTNKLYGSGGRLYRVSKIIVHPNFHKTKMLENDIAVVKVTKPFKLTGKEGVVKLPSQSQLFAADTPVTVIGWGYDKTNGVVQSTLMEVDLLVLADADCGVANFTKEKLCSYSPGNGKGDCQGDSGGPLFLKSDLTQIGIVSYGEICGQNPNVYAEVSNYITWIKDNIK